jgi:16S rRNA processing protein RimM
VRGEFKVQPLTDFPEERLAEPGPRWLRAAAPPGRAPRGPPAPPARVELEWGRASVFKGREVWLVKLGGVECPEDVGPLRGQLLLVPTAARAPLEDEDEVYTTDLVGLAVFLAAGGEEVGAVVEVLGGTGTHDVLRIRLREGFEPAGGAGEEEEEEEEEKEGRGQAGAAPAAAYGRPRFALVPFVRSIVPVVDVAGGRMEISPPAGLLELAAAGAPRVRRAESAGRRDRRNPRPVRGRPAPAAEGAPAAP